MTIWPYIHTYIKFSVYSARALQSLYRSGKESENKWWKVGPSLVVVNRSQNLTKNAYLLPQKPDLDWPLCHYAIVPWHRRPLRLTHTCMRPLRIYNTWYDGTPKLLLMAKPLKHPCRTLPRTGSYRMHALWWHVGTLSLIIRFQAIQRQRKSEWRNMHWPLSDGNFRSPDIIGRHLDSIVLIISWIPSQSLIGPSL